MKHHSYGFLSFFVASIVSACASDGNQIGEEHSGTDKVRSAQTTTLAKVDVGYGSLEFYKTTIDEGATTYGVLETASAYASSTPFAATMGEKRHTMLEIFKAVAPEQTPPAELVANHPQEARRLNRTTVAVEPASFDKNAPIKKAVQACVDHIWETPYCTELTNKLERTSTDGGWLPVGTSIGDFGYFTMGAVLMGVCNATDIATRAHFLFNDDPTTEGYHWRGEPRDLPAWTQLRDWCVSNAYYDTVYVPGNCPSPGCPALKEHPARYAVTHDPGAGATLMTAMVGDYSCPIY